MRRRPCQTPFFDVEEVERSLPVRRPRDQLAPSGPAARRYGFRIALHDDDETLIAAAQHGDERALDELLRRHQGTIHAVCRRLAGNDDDAVDAAQNALMAIVRGLPRFDGRASFTTWAYRIATNACLDELRRRSRRPIPGLPEVERAEHTDAARRIADPADAVATRMELDACLARLNESFRVPVVLRDIAGLSYDEIATVLDLAPGTVRSRIARGRSQLATAISRNQR